MSLILDALKKSEAERQRGQAPGLFVEQAPLARARREGPPAWALGLGGLLLAVLLLFGWREWSREAPAPVPVPVQVPEAPAPQPSPASGRGSETTAVLPLPPGAGRGEVRPAPVDTPPPATPSPQPSPASGRGSQAAPAPQPAAARGTGSETTAFPPLPRLADLPPGERATLPPLRLTMHVYAEAPDARFVILDGRRLGEGAQVAEGLVLREIRRDGVVLATPSRELLLPRP